MSAPLPDWRSLPRDERIKRIRRLLADGLSMGRIAAHFQNVTRNAIIGLVHRVEAAEGEPMKRNSHKQSLRTARAASTPAPKPKSWRKPFKAKEPATVVPSHATEPQKIQTPVEVQISQPLEVDLRIPRDQAFQPIPGVKPLPLTDLPNRLRCRWPLDTPGERHFACGAGTASETHVYCAPHRLLSIRGAQSQGAI
jgi:GcrA cell cycle regulator